MFSLNHAYLNGCLLAGLAIIGVCLACTSTRILAGNESQKPEAQSSSPQTVSALNNQDFYKDGVFQAEIAKEAYFKMMQRFNYPIPSSLKTGMWVTDFGLGDFVHVGMAGIFWYNDKSTNVFAHEIFLLPGQMIVEHAHEAAGDTKPKREAWHVRYGAICTFGEGKIPAEPCPVILPTSQKPFITAHSWKWVNPGELNDLKRATARHFMIAGPVGAIVTEYGTFHDNAGLRFTNPNVKF